MKGAENGPVRICDLCYILDLPRLRSIMENREASALSENIMVREFCSTGMIERRNKLFSVFQP